MIYNNDTVKHIPYDPGSAYQSLVKSGWIKGVDGILAKNGKRFSFTLITNNGNEVRGDICSFLQDNLKKYGIEVKIEKYDGSILVSKYLSARDFDAVVGGWQLDPNSYDQFSIWHSSQTNRDQLNFASYSNPVCDSLLSAIRCEYNDEIKIKLCSKLQKTVYYDQPYLFLEVPEQSIAIWKNTLVFQNVNKQTNIRSSYPLEEKPNIINYSLCWICKKQNTY
jgi:peptide/nickel transport system substrate-binding protein